MSSPDRTKEESMSDHCDNGEILGPAYDPWDVFELDDEAAESEPEYGDFWGELDDDYTCGG
jgi:hypothetical protein